MSVDPTGGSPIGNLIFLSYRRADAAPQTLALKLELERNLSAVQVFMDNGAIVGGDKFPDEINDALGAATLVIAMIGKEWLGGSEVATRRIDDPDDWVFKEVSFALRNKTGAVLPVLVDDTPNISEDSLPKELQGLSKIQAARIAVSRWEASIDLLLRLLEKKFQFVPKARSYEYPKEGADIKSRTPPYLWKDLQTVFRFSLPKWIVEFVDDPDRVFYKWINIRRDFKFESYERAIEFVNIIAKHSIEENHHPQFLVTWTTVTVWTSTWVVGHRITSFDVAFADYLERKYQSMSGAQ